MTPKTEMKRKIILDLCGGTGAWSRPYADVGYDVRNITLPEFDVRKYSSPENIYGILVAPPCNQFSFCRSSPKNPRDLRGGMEIIIACLKIIWECQYDVSGMSKATKKTKLKFWALENPYFGLVRRFLGKPAFVFDPWEFGDDYKKRTALWGFFNEPRKTVKQYSGRKFDTLKTNEIHSEFYGKLSRTERRAITPQGFAKAFFEANK